RRGRGGRHARTCRIDSLWAIIPASMGFADVWNRTLVYFGIAEEDDWDEDGYATNEELERSYAPRERANVRRLQPRRGRDFDDWTDPEPGADETAVVRPAARLRGVEAVPH